MSRDERFFQFPLSLLVHGKTWRERCEDIVSYCTVHEGARRVPTMTAAELKSAVKEFPAANRPAGFDQWDPNCRALVLGMNLLSVRGGGVESFLNEHNRAAAFVRQVEALCGRDASVRVKSSLVFAVRDGKFDARQFAVLCGLYSLIGKKPYPVVCRREVIGLRAMGYKSRDAALKCAPLRTDGAKPFTLDQVRYTLDALEAAGWFARVQASPRNTYFSHRLTRDEMLTKLAEKLKLRARPAAHRAHEREFFRKLKASPHFNNGLPHNVPETSP